VRAPPHHPGVQAHFDDFGLESEFATYGQIKNLSGGLQVATLPLQRMLCTL